jgi:hypothetical protein
MNTDIHYKYWTDSDHQSLKQTTSFTELGLLAISIVRRFTGKVNMVSGPISTGGVGTIQGNKDVFMAVIEILAQDQKNIFSQMPFEDKIVELYKKWRLNNPQQSYCMPILEEFYEPLFSTGKVECLNFIYDWESSFGAKWEHTNCDRWLIKRNYLPKIYSSKF